MVTANLMAFEVFPNSFMMGIYCRCFKKIKFINKELGGSW